MLDFFRHGFVEGKSDTGKICWVVRSKYPGYIDIEIDATALEQLRRSLLVKAAHSISEAVDLVKSFAQSKANEPWGSPLDFPMPSVVPTVLPEPRYGHRIEGKTIAETWVKQLLKNNIQQQ